jgi:5-methylcytosine-specific restriction endonuclease McrA
MSVWPYTTRQWERVRQQKTMRDPLCEACLQIGEIVPAEVVDHRTPISKEGRKKRLAAEAFPPLDRLASLCARCHNHKTRAEQCGEDYLLKGCDVFGNPNDPRHPWYKKGAQA